MAADVIDGLRADHSGRPPAEVPPRQRRSRTRPRWSRRRWLLVVVGASGLVALISALVVLHRYDPLAVGDTSLCCRSFESESAGGTVTVIRTGEPDDRFSMSISVRNDGNWPVRIESIGQPETSALANVVGDPEIRLIDDRDVGTGEPSAPFAPFTLDGGQHRFVLLRADASVCPSVHMIKGSSGGVDTLTVRWSVYGVHHTSHLQLAESLSFMPADTCFGTG